jgi:hypothetical protein
MLTACRPLKMSSITVAAVSTDARAMPGALVITVAPGTTVVLGIMPVHGACFTVQFIAALGAFSTSDPTALIAG